MPETLEPEGSDRVAGAMADLAARLEFAERDPGAVVAALAAVVVARLGDLCVVYRVEPGTADLELVCLQGRPEVTDELRRALTARRRRIDDPDAVGEAIRTGRPVVVDAAGGESFAGVSPGYRDYVESFRPQCFAVVPMRAAGRIVGVLGLTRFDPDAGPLGESDVDLLRVLADSAAMALRNAELFGQVQEWLDQISEFARALAEGYDISQVVLQLTGRVARALAVSAAGLALAEDGELCSVTVSAPEMADLDQESSRQGPGREAFLTGREVRAGDLGAEATRWPALAGGASSAGLRSVAAVPLLFGQRPIGALSLYDHHCRAWSDAEMSVARAFADLATAYIVNAREAMHQRQLAERLRTALDSRIVIEQAKGIVAEREGISVDAAFERLRAHARNHNATLRSVAEAVVGLGLRV